MIIEKSVAKIYDSISTRNLTEIGTCEHTEPYESARNRDPDISPVMVVAS
jgi:hypothetical protein